MTEPYKKTNGVVWYFFKPNFVVQSGGLKLCPRWAGAPPGKKKFSVKFRQKSRPHPLKFSVRTPWNFFCPHPLDKKCYLFIF
ncbi:hypothetical protein HanXRQr2_Chr01g0043181 [Helianthus annuus]|uniref:Uncharacterized protein n=1 Tax=Helianthus annuus TaxID=4232 RepID=A0A9K3JYL2_HELAN|nr:hypothetical protein HanXRQr2_Chr01g0043181 [Helianthus annuus]